jgi:hypothetical protein
VSQKGLLNGILAHPMLFGTSKMASTIPLALKRYDFYYCISILHLPKKKKKLLMATK